MGLACIGILSHSKGTREGWLDLKALAVTKANGPRRRVAVGNIRNEVIRLVKQSLFLAVGIVAMNLPSPMFTAAGLFSRSVFILAEILMVYASIAQNLDRKAIQEDVQARLKKTRSKRLGGS